MGPGARPGRRCRLFFFVGAIAAARRAILRLRESEEIGDDAFHRLEEELDWAELSAQG